MADIKAHAGAINLDTGAPIEEWFHDNTDGSFSRYVAVQGGGLTATVDQGTDSDDANATQAHGGVGVRGWLSTLVSLFRAGTAKVQLAAGSTIIGKVGIDQTTPGTTNAVAPAAQKSATDTLQNAATATVALAASPTGAADGYETLIVVIANGSDGSAVVTVTGSLDGTFAVAQDALPLGVVKLSDSAAGVNTSRSVVSGVVTVAAHTTALYQIYDTLPQVRAPLTLSGRTAGSVTVTLYKMAV